MSRNRVGVGVLRKDGLLQWQVMEGISDSSSSVRELGKCHGVPWRVCLCTTRGILPRGYVFEFDVSPLTLCRTQGLRCVNLSPPFSIYMQFTFNFKLTNAHKCEYASHTHIHTVALQTQNQGQRQTSSVVQDPRFVFELRIATCCFWWWLGF